ncbi:allergen Tab y 5.0101-like [Eurosta solidaginis]|uniref:allergen Tab y 5.0101-like n=1 Tax=Eurosta solidaginis TaxID=178769 RepID=UPI00353151E8
MYNKTSNCFCRKHFLYFLAMSSVIMLIIIIGFAFNICGNVAAFNYFCSTESWCDKGKHLMCDTSSISEDGTFKRHVPLTFKFRRTFLEQHNKLRDSTAGTQKATRMRNIIWDNELAYLARTHTGLCPDKPSECHRTARFEKVGLNTDIQGGADRIKVNTLITKAFEKWQTTDSPSMIIITNDQASRVGCAIGHCTACSGDKEHCYYISCYYDMDKKEGAKTYETGNAPASKCNIWDTVQDEKYTNLCHNTGKIF